ncbi:hypothetical protein ACFL35_18135 [Candidatus Riflebacteria bacterium]
MKKIALLKLLLMIFNGILFAGPNDSQGKEQKIQNENADPANIIPSSKRITIYDIRQSPRYGIQTQTCFILQVSFLETLSQFNAGEMDPRPADFDYRSCESIQNGLLRHKILNDGRFCPEKGLFKLLGKPEMWKSTSVSQDLIFCTKHGPIGKFDKKKNRFTVSEYFQSNLEKAYKMGLERDWKEKRDIGIIAARENCLTLKIHIVCTGIIFTLFFTGCFCFKGNGFNAVMTLFRVFLVLLILLKTIGTLEMHPPPPNRLQIWLVPHLYILLLSLMTFPGSTSYFKALKEVTSQGISHNCYTSFLLSLSGIALSSFNILLYLTGHIPTYY